MSIIAALSVALLAGCSVAGYRKSDAVAMSMKSAAAEVQTEGRHMEQAMACLKKLVNQPEGDLKLSFKQFSQSLERLKTSARRTDTTGKTMASKSSAYFQAWDKQLGAIDYEHIRELSSGRRSEVTNRFAVIERRYRESQEAVEPLITYLQDIRTALDADLTPAGIQSMKDVVQNADVSAQKVRFALQALTTELVDSSTRFASIAQGPPEVVPPPE